MKIEILGTACPKCQKLYAEAEQATAEAGVTAELRKVEKIGEIMDYGVMVTPALAIDGVVRASGRIPPRAEIVAWMAAAAGVPAT
jgi:small redox-active disulfide protein 2